MTQRAAIHRKASTPPDAALPRGRRSASATSGRAGADGQSGDSREATRSSRRGPSGRPATPDDLPDVLQFMRLLWAVVHALDRTSKRMSAELGVTGPQRLVLRVVGLFPGASAGELAALLHVHPSTLTGVLKRLVRLGLLVRSTASMDRRRSVLTLTDRGLRANRMKTGTVEAAAGRVLKALSPAERAATRRALSHVARHLTPHDK